jgi:hypothetical protein
MIVIEKYQKLFLIILISLSIASCKEDRWDIELGNIKEDVKIKRFEKDLFNIDTSRYLLSMKKLNMEYPGIFNAYKEYIFRLPPDDSTMIYEIFRKDFIGQKDMRVLYNDVQQKYGDKEIQKLEGDLSDAFSHIKYYYPKDPLPHVSTVITAFGFQSFTYENDLGISLDLFLGEDYKFYRAPQIDFSGFQTRRFKQEYIVPEVLKTIFGWKYNHDDYTDNTMLSEMIFAGKTLLFLDAMKPGMHDSLKIGYTKDQLNWIRDYEGDLWKHFAGKELLFSTNHEDKMKFFTDGPFTNAEGVPQEAPPRLAEWLGWQIVRKYMDENKEVTLQQLFEEKDARKILAKARYKPKS